MRRQAISILLLTGCVPSLSVDNETRIGCTRDGECPPEWVCYEAAQRCIPLAEYEAQTSPPASAPLLVPPQGQSAVKDGDTLFVEGSAHAGAEVTSVRLIDANTGAELMAIPAEAVRVTETGELVGALTLVPVSNGTSIAVEVIVALDSIPSTPEESRSLPLFVDNQPPTDATLAVTNGTSVAATPVTLALSAIGAEQVFLDGDLADNAAVRHWIALAATAAVDLTGTPGTKSLVARYRDGAANEVQATAAVLLDAESPAPTPSIASLREVAAVKNGDVIIVGGDAGTGVTVQAADVIDLDGSGTEITGCSTDVSGSVSIVNGSFSGTPNVSTRCVGSTSVALRLVVASAAGVFSSATTTNSLRLDNDAPTPGTARLLNIDTVQNGYSRQTDIILALNASEADGGAVEVYVEGDLSSGRIDQWVPFPGDEVVIGEEPVSLTSNDGAKTIQVRFRDAVGNETTPATVAVSLDTVPPQALDPAAVRVIETSPEPTNPSKIAMAYNDFTISGDAGAMAAGDRALVFAEAELITLMNSVTVAADGSFTVLTTYNRNDTKTFYVIAEDLAGHRSAATPVAAPIITSVEATPDTQRAGEVVTITFTASTPLVTVPVVTVDGLDATFVNVNVAGNDYTYAYTPGGTETQGDNMAVVRIIGEEDNGSLAPGSLGTQAVTMTLDFEPPTAILSSHPDLLSPIDFAIFLLTCDDPPCTFECSLDGASSVPCTSPTVFGGLGFAQHDLSLLAKDLAGNTQVAATGFHWGVYREVVRIWSSPRANHACAMSPTDRIQCWGYNGSGQLGDLSDDNRNLPTPVASLQGFLVDLAVGSDHTCGVLADETAYCWGYNYDGQLGDGTYNSSIAPVVVLEGPGWMDLDAGDDFTGGLKSDGSIWMWGANGYGQLGTGRTESYWLTPEQVPYGPYRALSLGERHACAIDAMVAGLYCWGYNSYDQLGDGSSSSEEDIPVAVGVTYNWLEVSAGGRATCGLVQGAGAMDRNLYCWGTDANGISLTAVDSPTRIGTDSDWMKVSVGDRHACGLKTGEIYCWGRNAFAQLGTADTLDSPTPVLAGTFDDWVDVVAAKDTTYAIRSDATLWVWGSNAYGRAGLGIPDSSINTPTMVTGY